ncbi:MAG TPA: three-Cys-motif partner protein TcmP [Patescibacteria group bacterium]|nr:three-Cys-motif partner protein TcmP [Patescibacteria group bacterium]
MGNGHPVGGDGLSVRDSGIWAKEKLYYLEHYLDIFSVGMSKKWPGKLYYVDLFAGPGRCWIRETGEEIDGSPLIALKFNFSKYFFFESDPRCYEALEARVKVRAPEKLEKIRLIPGDCNRQISEVEPPGSSALGTAFIDPTGISQIAFKTIRQLTAHRKIDLIMNFPEGMGIRMNLHQYTDNEGTALDTFMGSAKWRDRFHTNITSFNQACKQIAEEYLDNLRALDYQVVDGSQIPVKTAQNQLLYYLLFASKDPKGNEFWRKIGLINPSGQREMF